MAKRKSRHFLKDLFLKVKLYLSWIFHYYIGRHIYNFIMSPYTRRMIKYKTFKQYETFIKTIERG